MKYVRPDYYDDFKCIDEKCTHSCCVGWEIEIDEDSLNYYSTLEGKTGEKLRRCISKEPEPHFILEGNKRCPFLNDCGLCELILELGEDSLCDICSEHPRYYNEFSGRTEYGVGMCCEAAADLLLSGSGRVCYVCEDDGDNELEEELEAFSLRDKMLDSLNADGDFINCMTAAAGLVGTKLPETDVRSWAKALLELERLDEAWTEKLEGLCELDARELKTALNDARYKRVADYFLFRYFAAAPEKQRGAVVCFAYFAAVIICALDIRFGRDREHLRLFSSEIEYSDENVGLLLDKFT